MTDTRLFAWHLIVSPVAGALITTGAFAIWLRPRLDGPMWMLDVAASVCAAIGLLAGGVLGFRLSPWTESSGAQRRARPDRWLPLGTFGFSTLGVLAALVLAGVPVMTAPTMSAVVAGAAIGTILLARRRPRI